MSNKINLKILLYMLFFSLSLFIISLIAYIDIEKNFLNYKIEQFNISIDIEVDRIKESLDNGSTLKTFIGYKRLYERIIDSDKSIVHAQIYDAQNNLIFTKRDTTVYKHNKFNEITSVKNITIKENSIYYSINHKIIYNNNFIGNITILVDKEVLFINLNFVFYLLTVIFVIIFFTIFYYFFNIFY